MNYLKVSDQSTQDGLDLTDTDHTEGLEKPASLGEDELEHGDHGEDAYKKYFSTQATLDSDLTFS